jgi:hypothetical protein
MPVKLKPTSQIKIRLGINPNGRVQRFTTHTCRKHMDKYLPFDTGTLATTADEQPNAVVYEQPYAKVVYCGVRNGKEINYHLDKHPLAGPYWDKRMVSAEIQDVVKEVQDYIGGK